MIIGEGEKDEAPMLFNGEKIGDGSPPHCDIAVDPVDGTKLTALGRGNALAVIALADRGSMYQPGPCVYMNKIVVGPQAKGAIDLDPLPRREPGPGGPRRSPRKCPTSRWSSWTATATTTSSPKCAPPAPECG